MKNVRRFLPASLGSALVTTAILGNHAHGQAAGASIVFDGSLGGQKEDLSGSTIFANRGRQAGANLFHSFLRFNVEKGKTATFQVPANTKHILARVTGGEHSTIQGTLGTDGPANLYLINPAGILFGSGASINVAGDFTATTANYVSLGEGGVEHGRFWATTDGTTTLVSTPPSSFGFLPPVPNSVPPGEFNGLVKISGADLFREQNKAGSQALSGFKVAATEVVVSDTITPDYDDTAIQFVALKFGEARLGEKRFELSEDSHGGAISIKNSFLRTLDGGSLSLVTPGSINVSGSGIIVETPERGEAGEAQTRTLGESWLEGWKAGLLFHAGGDITISGKSDLIVTNNASGQAASTVLVAGRDLTLKGDSRVILEAGGDHSVGSIVLSAGVTLMLSGKSVVKQTVTGDDATGSMVLSAGGDLILRSDESNSNPGVSQTLKGLGSGGDVLLTSGRDMILTGFVEISQSNESTGNAASMSAQGYAPPLGSSGNGIRASAGGRILISDFARIITQSSASGRGGDIDIVANSLLISGPDSAFAGNQRTRSTGIETVAAKSSSAQGGDIRVTVDGSIEIRQAGGIYASTNGPGSSGSISVKGGGLEIVGAQNYSAAEIDPISGISPKNFFITGISSKSSPSTSGDAGSITVNVDGGIVLRRGGLIDATTFSDSDSGGVSVTADSILAERDGSDYFTGIGAGTETSGILNSTNGGRGANVTVKADSIRLFSGAQIAASSRASGDAGSVRVIAQSLHASGKGTETPFLFTSESGVAAATLGAGRGQGGSVFISAQNLILSDGASISSTNRSTASEGANAGSVVLQPGNLVVDHGRIEVSSKGGSAGSIRIEGGILLDFRHTEVVAEAYLDGGNISMEGARFILLDQSLISANAERGNGGNILLNAGVILNNGSQITASSRFGIDGIVRIDPQSALSGAEEQEDVDPLNATDSLQPECTNRLATAAGSFIRAGRGGTARLPGGYLPSLRLYRN